MQPGAQQVATSPERVYSATLISSEAGISTLSEVARPLLSRFDSTLQPRFFSASVEPGKWMPRIVAIRHGDSLVGVLYAKESKFAGIPTGIIYADASLGKMLVAEFGHFENALSTGVAALFKNGGTRAIRILVSGHGSELPILQRLLQSLPGDSCWTPAKNHSSLALPASFDSFLQSLGYHTRQDFRRYRRRFETASYEFVEKLSLAEYQRAAAQLLGSDAMKSDPHQIDRTVRILSVVDRPLLAGLRHANREWLSVVGGWYEADRFVLFSQLNSDRKYPRAQLSIVLRGYLIEMLIGSGIRSIVFWGGLGGPLIRYSKYIPCVALHLDSRDWKWRALRRVFPIVRPLLSREMEAAGEWIAPRAGQPLSSSDFPLNSSTAGQG
jgi:hypothetical protein